MKIYISGAITGLKDYDYELNFTLSSLYIDILKHTPVNPLNIRPLFGIHKYWYHMIADIWELLWCDAIWLQYNWTMSRGARIERRIAIILRKTVMYEMDVLKEYIKRTDILGPSSLKT